MQQIIALFKVLIPYLSTTRCVKFLSFKKKIAEPLLQRSNMSIEKGLSTDCTPAECYVHKRTRKHFAP